MRIFLSDPGLLDFKGHFFNYVHSIINVFRTSGHDVQVLGNRQMIPAVIQATGAYPAFLLGLDHQILPSLSEQAAQAQRRHALLQEVVAGVPVTSETTRMPMLRKASYDWFLAWHVDSWQESFDNLDAQFQMNESDLITINTLQYHHMIALAEWALRRVKEHGRASLPRFVIILHQSLCMGREIHKARTTGFHHAFQLITEAELQSHFLLFSDSPILSAEYSAVTAMEIGLLPIPHSVAEPPSSEPNSVPCICYPGTAGLDRGFQFLPDIVTHLLPEIEAGRVRMEIQAQLPPGAAPELQNALAWLRRAPVTIYEKSLTEDDYYGLFRRADICLIPALRHVYQSQTSGVFHEAVSYGNIVACPQGTWMSLMAERYGIGLTFAAGDVSGMCRALDQALANLDALRPGARAAASEWTKVNSPSGFLAAMARQIPGLLSPATCP